MTIKADHQKHAKLTKPALGQYHRNELAILGTNCTHIKDLVNKLLPELGIKYKIAYVDADHKAAEPDERSALNSGATVEFTDQISHRSVSYKSSFNTFQNHALFNDQELVLVNGNHFVAQSQIIVIDPQKPLDKKLDKLTNIELILLADGVGAIPQYIIDHLPVGNAAPVLKMSDVLAVAAFIDKYLIHRQPPLYGLVLAGGQSQRMLTDKGSIEYFGKSQRLHVHQMLDQFCTRTFISYANASMVSPDEDLPVLLDTFQGLGPYSGILSAMQHDPNAAWLTVACDLPYLSPSTLAYLVHHRDPSKIATCFMDSEEKFPEPLITIWEPRAYPILLQFLAQGYSCPRKVLINTDVAVLKAPDATEFINVNHPEERQQVLTDLKQSS